jgi:hypothetical protein
MHYIHDLHHKYGPFVRIAPQEIDVSDPVVFREIHQVGSGYLKSPWYSALRAGKFNDILRIIPPKQHAQRRRLFAQSFSVTSLRTNWESHIVEKVKLAVENIKREAQIGDADIYKWWTCMTTDVISHLSFGEPLDMLINNEVGAYAPLMISEHKFKPHRGRSLKTLKLLRSLGRNERSSLSYMPF